jgi:serine/threonine protein kinase
VERFIARGGNADVYQVKLLQRLWIEGTNGQAAVATVAPHDDKLQPGQYYAVKVAHSHDMYPAEVKQAGTARGQLMSDEWQVLQDMFTNTHIINAYMFGHVASNNSSSSSSLMWLRAMAVASSCPKTEGSNGTEQQQVQTSKPAAAAAPAGLPCVLMEYADVGSVRDMLYKQHAKPTPLSLLDTWHVMGAAVSALKDMHAAGYIHHEITVDSMLAINTEAGIRWGSNWVAGVLL